ncbi:MAG: aminopeptidase P N-terminal domain-containing protein [Campylobacterota bacterium]|nr:aminopeptidase P N-terminal domain-containing protein [Campylobacterota bacterium]
MIEQSEYVARRERLFEKLEKNSLVVLFSATQKVRSNDTEYPYRQNSNFYYLTGFKEDNSALVMIKEKKKLKTILFVQKKDKTLELWTGKRLGVKKAKKVFSLEEVYTTEMFEEKMQEYLKSSQNIYYDFGMQDERVQKLQREASGFFEHKNIAPLIGMLRLIKSDAEVSLIKKAINITKEAHHRAMKQSKSLSNEYELLADIEYTFKKNGAYSDAYTSIVACGDAANTLHYVSNDKKLIDDELILIDAGCEFEYYASDITRTIPVNGRFTPAQKELYSMVLDVQLKIIAMIKSGVKRSDLHTESEMLLCQGMIRLGLLEGKLKKLLKEKAHKKYYPHGIGHWMGIDVHDESPYKTKKGKEIPLEAGMVMTIEPGIYCPKDDMSIPEEYRGIGIRIEDNILVTENGCENLSSCIAKSIEEIEEMALN